MKNLKCDHVLKQLTVTHTPTRSIHSHTSPSSARSNEELKASEQQLHLNKYGAKYFNRNICVYFVICPSSPAGESYKLNQPFDKTLCHI